MIKKKTLREERKKNEERLMKKRGEYPPPKAGEINNRLPVLDTKISEIKKISSSGDIPDLFDFGITYQEAVFLVEYIKDYDELKAGLKAKIISQKMSTEEKEEKINEIFSNPGVNNAIRSLVKDQIQKTLLTVDRTLTQISKIAFSDVKEMFNPNTGTLKDVRDMPHALRCCIKEMTHTSVYEGRGEERRVTGYISRIKMHDSLKALQMILKDLRDKDTKSRNNRNSNTYNQYNQFNFSSKEELLQENIQNLSNDELDVLVKLSQKAKKPNKDEKETEEKRIYNISELKGIEECSLLKNG